MKLLAIFAASAGLLAVALGAFAAHGLKGQLSAQMLSTFQTGVQYQMYHALAVLLIVALAKQYPGPLMLWSGVLMLVGILLFSGSLYALALTGIKWFGPVTPIGGLCFIIGWLLLILAFVRESSAS